jgi:hypothetical protein
MKIACIEAIISIQSIQWMSKVVSLEMGYETAQNGQEDG